MRRWSAEEDALIVSMGSLGAEGVRDAIEAETGVCRTVAAVQRRASRIGATLVMYKTCPNCGKIAASLSSRTGLCGSCNQQFLANLNRERSAAIRCDVLSAGPDKEEETRRKRAAAARVAACRARKRGRK